MNDQPKSKLRWRLLRWGLIGLAVVSTLAAILVTEENWRGKRAWENYKREAEARGERFDSSAIATNNVPDDQNFAKSPVFSALTAMEWDEQTQDWKPTATNAVDRFKMSPYRNDGSSPPGVGGAWDRARMTRLENWQDYYRNPPTNSVRDFPLAPQPQTPAADVLLALSKFDSTIEELRVASRRPFYRFDEYSFSDAKKSSLILRYLAKFKSFSQVLQLRAIAELADNQSAKALDDVQLLLRLDDALRQEPLLIEHLVSLAITSITIQPIYEGLAQHRWNDAQLAELERALAAKDFLADFQRAMRGERTCAVDYFENQRINREYKTMVEDAGKTKIVTTSLRFMPSAYFYQNELAIVQLQEQFIRPLVDMTNRLVAPAALRQAQTAVPSQMKSYSPYTVQALMTFPAVSKSVMRFAHIQSWVDIARVACALERFHLTNGNYPETLDALAPRFIGKVPHDIINGLPLHYRRTDNGKFVLYSVAWNESDDGGQIVLNKDGQVEREKGDWV